MKKIDKITIIALKMEGFKKFKEMQEVRLDEITSISGANGEGKSSIADAVAFAFFGTNFWGERDYERLRNPFCNETKVEVTFVDQDGEIHNLSRVRKGETTALILDNQQINQNSIPGTFAERDIFLSILNPLYFIEKIASDGRAFLQRLLPPVENAEVFASMSEGTRVLIENENIGAPEQYIKTKRAEYRELEKACENIKGQIDLLNTQHKEAFDTLDDVIARGNVIVEEKGKMEEKQFEGIDVDELNAKLQNVLPDGQGERHKELLAKKAEAEARQYVSKCIGKMAELKTEVAALCNQSKSIAEKVKSIKIGDVCPTCGTVVTEENYNSIVSRLREEYKLVCEKGKNAVEAYKKLEELEKASIAKFEEFRKEDIKKAEEELKALGSGNSSEAEAIQKKLKYGNLTEEEYEKLCELRIKADEFAKEVDRLCETDKIPDKIEELEKKLSGIKAEQKKCESLAKAVIDFAAKKAEIVLKNLKMNRAAIKLTDVAKTTGEVKDVFKFTYDNKDYHCLSASEKIRAGLEVSLLLSRLTGLSYPTYIDNAECITNKIDMPMGQVVLAYARKEALNVQCRKKQQIPMKEAA